MDVHVRPEIAVAIGIAAGALIVAVLWLMVWIVKHLTGIAQALHGHAKVNAALNDELLQNIKERRTERETCDKTREAQVAEFADERREFMQRIGTLRVDSEKANKQVSDELIKVKTKLHQTETELSELKLKYERETLALRNRVSTLEEAGRQKDERIELLKGALDESEQDKNRLVAQVDKLTAALNGKADKPTPESGGETVTPEMKRGL